MDLILRSSAHSPSRVHVNHQNVVWSTLLFWVEPYIIVQCCVKDVEYVLIMPLFTFAIHESIICNSTQTIKLPEYSIHSLLEHRDISTVAKSKWLPFQSVLSPWGTGGAESAAFVITLYLPEPPPGVKNTKMGGTADFGYDIIYGSHIVVGCVELLCLGDGSPGKGELCHLASL